MERKNLDPIFFYYFLKSEYKKILKKKKKEIFQFCQLVHLLKSSYTNCEIIWWTNFKKNLRDFVVPSIKIPSKHQILPMVRL